MNHKNKKRTHWVPAKDKLQMLRIALGVTEDGKTTRDHIVIPRNQDNPFLDTAKRLEEDGMFCEEPCEEFPYVSSLDAVYRVTDKGKDECLRPSGYHLKRKEEESKTLDLYSMAISAQHLMLEIRERIIQQISEDNLSEEKVNHLKYIDHEITYALKNIGEIAYCFHGKKNEKRSTQGKEIKW